LTDALGCTSSSRNRERTAASIESPCGQTAVPADRLIAECNGGGAMGEKGNVEMLEQLKAMAQQQEPGLRDKVMDLISDFQTVRGLSGTGSSGDDEDGSDAPAGPQA
jgi:hypothetical protein